MTIKSVIFKLDPEEISRLTRILLDEEKEESPTISKGMPQTPIGPGDQESMRPFSQAS